MDTSYLKSDSRGIAFAGGDIRGSASALSTSFAGGDIRGSASALSTSFAGGDIRGTASALSTSFAGGDIGIICTPTFISAEYLYSILNRYIDTIDHIYYISDATNLIKAVCGQLGVMYNQINYHDFKTQLNVLYVFTDGMEPVGFKLLVEEFKDAGKEVHIFKTAFIDPRTGLY